MYISLLLAYVLYHFHLISLDDLTLEMRIAAKQRIEAKIKKFHRLNPLCTCLVTDERYLPLGYEVSTLTMYPVKLNQPHCPVTYKIEYKMPRKEEEHAASY